MWLGEILGAGGDHTTFYSIDITTKSENEGISPLHLNMRLSFWGNIEESQMVTGTVKFFNRTKHFGFIAGDDGKDYFVHATGLKPGVSIAEGDKVSFEVVAGDKGPKADKVDKAT